MASEKRSKAWKASNKAGRSFVHFELTGHTFGGKNTRPQLQAEEISIIAWLVNHSMKKYFRAPIRCDAFFEIVAQSMVITGHPASWYSIVGNFSIRRLPLWLRGHTPSYRTSFSSTPLHSHHPARTQSEAHSRSVRTRCLADASPFNVSSIPVASRPLTWQ